MMSMRRGDLQNVATARLNARQASLLARIHRRGYKTVTETLAVGPLRLPFTRIAEPDAVLDRIVEEEDRREKLTGQRRNGNELHLPYWAELWDSAVGIGQFLASDFDKVTRRQDGKVKNRQWDSSQPVTPSACHLISVLDLGCGMGLAGMVAAAMGANVILADLETDALLFAKLNTLRWSNRTRARRLNWQSDRLDETFDLIIGSDVLYDRSQWEFLEPFFQAHLGPGGQVLLGEPGRQTGDMFPDWIVQRGWKIDHLQQRVVTRATPIRIFKLVREAGHAV